MNIWWKTVRTFILISLFLIPVYLILYKIYIPRVNAFGCFDDCFNYVAAYFMLYGKKLYSEIYFNHQFLIVYISTAIQYLTHPENIYELVLRHRQFLLLFSFLFNFLLIKRFLFPGILFVLFYEFNKFYIFGDRFLAESFIVYPLVYMVGLVWNKLHKKHLSLFDYILCAVLTYFVIFMREPYTLSALFLFIVLLFGRPFPKEKSMGLACFASLTIITLLSLSLKDYVSSLFVHARNILILESGYNSLLGLGSLKIFFYPAFLLFGGEWNVFRQLLVGLSSVFLFLSGYLVFVKKQLIPILIIFIALALSNIRIVNPGSIFYEAFHMIPWYGMFVFLVFLIIQKIYGYQKKLALGSWIFLIGLFSYLIIQPLHFVHEKMDPHTEFITNYGKELQIGEVIRLLSNPSDTLFLDGFDDLIYWQAKLTSPYKYSWYTSGMPFIDKYAKARLEMFEKNPPDFYYGTCPKDILESHLMPSSVRKDYVQLTSLDKPTCVYVHKTKIHDISKEQWRKANEFLFDTPESF